MNRLLSLIVPLAALLAVPAAQAYIGPGAGLSLLGALWALLAAVGAAVVFLLAWPLRRLLRRFGARQTPPEVDDDATR